LASGVWLQATGDSSVPDQVMQQRESRDVDRLGGTATVQTVKFDRWLGSLWRGERLAFTLALLSLAVGGGLWWVGGLMGEDVGD
jgi:hypothetical protein